MKISVLQRFALIRQERVNSRGVGGARPHKLRNRQTDTPDVSASYLSMGGISTAKDPRLLGMQGILSLQETMHSLKFAADRLRRLISRHRRTSSEPLKSSQAISPRPRIVGRSNQVKKPQFAPERQERILPSTPQSNEKSALLQLPLELRLKIFDLVFDDQDIGFGKLHAAEGRPPYQLASDILSVLLTSRQIYAEYWRTAYSRTVFHISYFAATLKAYEPAATSTTAHLLNGFTTSDHRYLVLHQSVSSLRLEVALGITRLSLVGSFENNPPHGPEAVFETLSALKNVTEFQASIHSDEYFQRLIYSILRAFPALRRIIIPQISNSNLYSRQCLMSSWPQSPDLDFDHILKNGRNGLPCCIGLRIGGAGYNSDACGTVRHIHVVSGPYFLVQDILQQEWVNECIKEHHSSYYGGIKMNSFVDCPGQATTTEQPVRFFESISTKRRSRKVYSWYNALEDLEEVIDTACAGVETRDTFKAFSRAESRQQVTIGNYSKYLRHHCKIEFIPLISFLQINIEISLDPVHRNMGIAFLDLPAEVRLLIYRSFYPSTTFVPDNTCVAPHAIPCKFSNNTGLGLLLTCKSVYQESRDILYHNHVFHMVSAHLTPIGPSQAAKWLHSLKYRKRVGSSLSRLNKSTREKICRVSILGLAYQNYFPTHNAFDISLGGQTAHIFDLPNLTHITIPFHAISFFRVIINIIGRFCHLQKIALLVGYCSGDHGFDDCSSASQLSERKLPKPSRLRNVFTRHAKGLTGFNYVWDTMEIEQFEDLFNSENQWVRQLTSRKRIEIDHFSGFGKESFTACMGVRRMSDEFEKPVCSSRAYLYGSEPGEFQHYPSPEPVPLDHPIKQAPLSHIHILLGTTEEIRELAKFDWVNRCPE